MERAGAWLALIVTVVIWASYLVVTRLGVTGRLGWVDIGLLRSGTAALFFLPVTLRHGLFPGRSGWMDVAVMGGLGGFGFVFCLATGLTMAPVADSGVFTPSMLPVWVAAIAILFAGARYSRVQVAGLALIVAGALALGGAAAIMGAADGAWRGHLLFLGASACWAAYTVRFRVSGLAAIHGAAILATWSTMFFLVASVFTGIRLHEIATPLLVVQLAQGVAAGVVANFTYLYAIGALGAPTSAAAAAFVPVLAALGGAVFLAEPVSALKWLGVAVAASGVALASGLFGHDRPAGSRPG